MLETINKASTDPSPETILTQAEALGLTSLEFKHICKLLGKTPNETELHLFGTLWADDCSHKSSRSLLKPLHKEHKKKGLLGKIFSRTENENIDADTNIIDIGNGWGLYFKIKSHNHLITLESFEGASTGVGEVLRNMFTMGAKPVALMNSLRFGELTSEHTKQLFSNSVQGIACYGNSTGIPNVGGDVYFDSCYEGSPLISITGIGLMQHTHAKRDIATGSGSSIYYVGAETGREGLGKIPQKSFPSTDIPPSIISKADPFTGKLLMEACLEIAKLENVVTGIQSLNTAGLSYTICKMLANGKNGAELFLDKVPLREAYMAAHEILLSESQERALMVVQKDKETLVEEIFKKWDLPAIKIGKITNTGRLVAIHQGSPVVNVPVDALINGAPLVEPECREPEYLRDLQSWRPRLLKTVTKENIQKALLTLLADPTIANKQWIWQQYDHRVLANTVILPGSDAAIIRLRLNHGKNKYIAITNDGNNRYCYVNPYRGAQIAVAEALRNLACSGAPGLGIAYSLHFGNPHQPESAFYLRECVKGLASACDFFDLPTAEGNVSLYNEHPERSIGPTLIVSATGLLESLTNATRQYVNRGDETFILLGGLPNELGMSRYLQAIHGLKTGDAPLLNLEDEKNLHSFILKQIQAHRVIAAHDISEGGLLVAICEMLFGQKTFGAKIDLQDVDYERAEAMLFGESQNRAILAVGKWQVKTIMKEAKLEGLTAHVIGEATNEAKVELLCKQLPELEWDAKELRAAWEGSLPKKIQPAFHR